MQALIRAYFEPLPHSIDLFELPDDCNPKDINEKIQSFQPDKIIAVGGDGTVKLAAQCSMKVQLPLGILPAGSANGMAKELGIPADPDKAMEILVSGECQKIHLVDVNGELCIHLSDIGFNAFVIKKFDGYQKRGMWSYVKATWQVLRSHSYLQVELKVDGETKQKKAAMIVIANATRYGTGAVINPNGSLTDDMFEIIVIKKISFKEILKMMITHQPYDPVKTEVYQTGFIQITSKRKAHFQVDGEYLGKINKLKASIMPSALEMIVPAKVAMDLQQKTGAEASTEMHS